MPIEISCTGCRKRLRLPDKAAGKRIKCPNCSAVVQVPSATDVLPAPASAPAAAAESSSPDRWYFKSEDGEDYGPVPKSELDQWLKEGRITAESQILREGADQWQWGDDVYPELKERAEETSAATPPPPQPATSAPAPFPIVVTDGLPQIKTRSRKQARKSTRHKIKNESQHKDKNENENPPAAAPPAPTPAADAPAAAADAAAAPDGEVSPKSRLVAGLLGIFLGGLGIQRFYLGYTLIGLLMLVTAGGCGVWSLIDAVLILLGKVPDAQGRPLRG